MCFLLLQQGQPQATMSCSQLHKRAERIGALLMDKGKLNTGDHVALVYPPGLDLICAFYGCLYVGQYFSLFPHSVCHSIKIWKNGPHCIKVMSQKKAT